MVTPFLSQIALSFGCDDVEGTVVYERIYHEAGAQHRDAHALSRAGGADPRRRASGRSSANSLYEAVRDDFDDPPPMPAAARAGASLPVVHAA